MNENLENLKRIADDLTNLAKEHEEYNPKLALKLRNRANMIGFLCTELNANQIMLFGKDN